jgi:hypothetical protein
VATAGERAGARASARPGAYGGLGGPVDGCRALCREGCHGFPWEGKGSEVPHERTVEGGGGGRHDGPEHVQQPEDVSEQDLAQGESVIK